MDYASLTFDIVIKALAVLIIIYEVFKKIMEIKRDSDKDHERKQGWDYAAKVIKEKEDKWDKGRRAVIHCWAGYQDPAHSRTYTRFCLSADGGCHVLR